MSVHLNQSARMMFTMFGRRRNADVQNTKQLDFCSFLLYVTSDAKK